MALVLFYDKVFGGKKPQKLQNEALTSTSELVIDSFPYEILVSLKKNQSKNKEAWLLSMKKNQQKTTKTF